MVQVVQLIEVRAVLAMQGQEARLTTALVVQRIADQAVQCRVRLVDVLMMAPAVQLIAGRAEHAMPGPAGPAIPVQEGLGERARPFAASFKGMTLFGWS